MADTCSSDDDGQPNPPPAPAVTAAADRLVSTLPSDAAFAAHFDRLASASPFPVSVRPSPHGGKGLFVTARVKKGDVILVESPLISSPQGFQSRGGGLVCSACGRSAGGPASQAAHAALAAGNVSPDDVPAFLRIVAGLDAVPGTPALRASAPGAGGRWVLPAPRGPTPCPGGCADELYCSAPCATADWAACHGAVCAGDGGDGGRAAAGAALAHAAAHGNEAVWLAARAVGGCVARAVAAADAGASPADALTAAWRPWAVAEKALWWEQPAWPPAPVGLDDGGGGGATGSDDDGASVGSEGAFRAGLRGLCEDAAAALSVLVRPPPPLPLAGGPPPPCPRLTRTHLLPLATPAVVGALIGAFELNNLEVAVPGLGASLDEGEGSGADAGPAPPKRAAGRGRGRPRLTWPALLAAAGGALPSASSAGSAFYPLQACANHSCAPTARAVPGAGTHGLAWVVEGGRGEHTTTTAPATKRRSRSSADPLPPPLAPSARPTDALLIAAGDLEPGDEVTLCYVPEGAHLKARAAALRDYGIDACGCARCVRERGEHGGGGGGGGEAAGEGAAAPAPGLRKAGGGSGGRGGRQSAWVGAWRA